MDRITHSSCFSSGCLTIRLRSDPLNLDQVMLVRKGKRIIPLPVFGFMHYHPDSLIESCDVCVRIQHSKTVDIMKTWFIGVISLLTSICAQAQWHLQGSVQDASTQQALPGAQLSLQGPTSIQLSSDPQGHFSISQLPSGAYHLTLHYIGYKDTVLTIHLHGNLDLSTTALHAIGLFIKPVEISSTRASKDAPFTQTTLQRAEIQPLNLGQDLPFLLNQQPSVMTTSDAGAGTGYTGIWIRGTDATRINVTINGMPVNDAESSGVYWVDLPDIVSSSSSIQIQRGVGTSTNGAGAFGGTINISTNQFHDQAYADLDNSYGSFNTWKHTISAGTGLLDGHFTNDVRLSLISSAGYIDRASSNLKSFYYSGAYLSKKTALRFNVFSGKEKTYQAWDGVPQDSLHTHRTYNDLGLMPNGQYYPNQTDNYMQTYYQLFLNQQINPSWDFNVGTFMVRGKGYYEEYKIGEAYSDYGLSNPILGTDTLTTTDLIRDLWLDNYFYGTVFSLNHQGSWMHWSLGGGWNRYDGQHYGDVVWARYAIDKGYRYYDNTAHKYDASVYWKADKSLSTKLHAYADLQYRYVKYDINGFDHNPQLIEHNPFSFFNPKLGFSYQLTQTSRLYASYAIAHKEPNRDDFEANQDQRPQAEVLRDLEAGYDGSHGSNSWHADFYYMNYLNQLVLTGKINDVGAYTRTNILHSYRLGLEARTEIKLAEHWDLDAHASVSRNKIPSFTEYIDNYDNGGQNAVLHHQTDISFSPDVMGGASLHFHPWSHGGLVLFEKYVSRRFLDNTSNVNRSLDPYWDTDLEFQYSWHPKWCKGIDANLLLSNLFQAMYETNGYTYTYVSGGQTYTDNSYFPQAGFHLMGGISLHF